MSIDGTASLQGGIHSTISSMITCIEKECILRTRIGLYQNVGVCMYVVVIRFSVFL